MKKRTLIAACAAAVAGTALLPGLALAQSNKPIKIALIASKTGPSEQYARDTERGLRIGLEQLTQGTMTVLGRKIELIVKDDTGTPDVTKRLAQELVVNDKVAVLDGGFAKWTKEGRPVNADVPLFTPLNYPIKPRQDFAVDVGFVSSNLKNLCLVDARAPARYRGEQEPIDPVAGRIPGAKNRFNLDNVSAQGTFKSPEALKKEFQSVLEGRAPSEVIHYCGSGVAACHNLLAMEVAGLKGGKLYAGSWSEWARDPKRPQERG